MGNFLKNLQASTSMNKGGVKKEILIKDKRKRRQRERERQCMEEEKMGEKIKNKMGIVYTYVNIC